MVQFEIIQRTLEAKNYPPKSKKRKVLNESPLTSEYMPSYRYLLVATSGANIERSFRTKKEAMEKKEEYLQRYNPQN